MKNLAILLLSFTFIVKSYGATPSISSFAPTSVALGETVTITGTNFTAITSVTFGGANAASYTVVSSTQITAVLAAGTSGQVAVTNASGSGTKTGFVYISTPAIITDFGGYWSSVYSSPNSVIPDSSHALLAFTFNGITYSTGVNNSALTSHSVSFTPGNFRALPVAGITGITGATSTYLALADKVDGSLAVANTPAVANYSIKSVLVDGPQGLNLGTGVTNLPAAAVLTFQIFNIDPSKISDNEPAIILTQIAQPSAGNDVFSFVDALGNIVGTSFTQDMTLLPKFGTYNLDLFNLTPSTPYNNAVAYSAFATNTNRDIRLVAVKLSDFNITTGNVSQVKALKITPSGNSDYAFIAYNANALNLPPNISQDAAITNSTICSGGTATLAVLASPAAGGALSYSWEESTDGGTTWATITDGGNYSGSGTNKLTITNATNGYRYEATVTEAGNSNSSTSAVFTISVGSPAPPSSVTVSGTASVCLNSPVQLTSSVSGGSNLYYQWQSNASGSYQDIAGATLNNYVPPVNQTGAISYLIRVSSGSGCSGSVVSATPATITVTGIASTTPASICGSGSALLSATATSGTINWYSTDAGGSSLVTANTYTTPSLGATTIYYVSSSGCSSALRVPVTATVYPVSVGGSIAGGTSVTSGTNSTTLTLNNATGSVVEWQSSTDNFASDINDISSTDTFLTVTNLTQTTEYRAAIQSGTCPSVFSGNATIIVTGALAINNADFTGTQVNNNIVIEWTAYNQANTAKFEIEKSGDGVNFYEVYTTSPGKNNSLANAYKWIDTAPFEGNNFYRIKEVLIPGNFDYTGIIKVEYKSGNPDITIFPNPVKQRIINLLFNNIKSGTYQVRFVNNAGQVSSQVSLIHTAYSTVEKIEIPNNITNGIFRLEITSPSFHKTFTLEIL